VIQSLAASGSCVFVGRCADYVLRRQRCLNVFITADMPCRIERVMYNTQNKNEKQVRELIEKTDKRRAAYYNYFTGKTWGASSSYHLCINSSALGVEKTAAVIEDFVKNMK